MDSSLRRGSLEMVAAMLISGTIGWFVLVSGQPVLDYPISDYLWQGMRQALLAMAELQFAAGASQVLPIHHDANLYNNWHEAKAAILQLPMQKLHLVHEHRTW